MKTLLIKNSFDLCEAKKLLTHVKKLAVDLEGVKLCRSGRILFIQMYAIEIKIFVIFDCSNLSAKEIKEVGVLENH